MGDEITEQGEFCPRCGAKLYAFSKKRAAADSIEYCIKCAEQVDREYLEAYTCSVCKKTMAKSEVKFVMPSTAFGSSDMPLHKRLLCSSCYHKYTRPSLKHHISMKVTHAVQAVNGINRQLIRSAVRR
ncbi:MAG: hypothetical protein ACP5RM_03485 [Candidatus Micrarchaeia archaeon]